MKRKISGTQFICDGCFKSFIVPKGEEQPAGFYGNVFDTDNGMQKDFFACSADCLRTAPENALAGRDG